MSSDLTSCTGSGNHQPSRERRSQFGKDAPIAATYVFPRPLGPAQARVRCRSDALIADAGGPISGTALAPQVYALIGVGLAAIVLVWDGIWSRRIRVGVVALIPQLSLAGHANRRAGAWQHHQDRLSAIGVTMYLPDISDATPSGASAWGTASSDTARHIEISYHSANSADLEGPRLILLTTTDGGCGEAERAGYLPGGVGPPDSTCRKTADGFAADDPTTGHYAGVTRGHTMLVLLFLRSSLGDAKIADSLRHAPQVSVADLARL